jgi:cephalosporin-C deacetylase-like acetyl esterase
VLRHCLAFFALATSLLAQTQNDLNFLTNHVDGRERAEMLPRYLLARADRQLAERQAAIARIKTPQDLAARSRLVKEKLRRITGDFPEKTPLNARVTGTIDLPEFKIEKVIFESQPGFHVTASLYLPKSGVAPHPAILFPLGHEAGAKSHEAWQRVLATFAKRGYVCFAWDTIGQGERIQLWDEAFQASKVIRSTTEHTIVGLQTVLVGDPLNRYTIWDGIRAMDYLLSRPEVDPKRVGLTGNSGGGTHTAYLSAFDDRFAAAAPSCYITSWSRLLRTIGPQDAEQCTPGFLAEGLDHGDFLLAFAPKPALMLTAIRDFFSIEGARSTAAELARVYDSTGNGGRFGIFEADDGHGYTAPRRGASFRFFSRWLEGREDTSPEPETKILSERELWCTRTGQVATEFRGETVFTLNQKRFAQVKRGGTTAASVRQFIGYSPASGAPRITSYGSGDGIEKLTFESEPGIYIPALLYAPPGTGKHPAVILAWGQGKASAHDEARRLVAQGKVVLSLDLRGLGETRRGQQQYGSDWQGYFGDYESAMTAMLTGKPLVAMRAEDIARAVDLLAARADVDGIELHGKDSAAVPALHAAAFDARIKAVTLERMLVSYESIIRNPIHRQQWENAVPGALRHYDLPDLIRFIAPRPVKVIEPLNPLGMPAN